MLYVYYGNDVVQVRQKAFSFLHSFEEKSNPDVLITVDRYETGMMTDLLGSTSLFGETHIVYIDTPSEDTLVFKDVVAHAEAMQASQNMFVLIEGTLLAADKKIFQKCGATMDETVLGKKEAFNAFSLTDAFLRRDKKSLWLLLMEAWKEGLSNEEIIGVLFWQVKILRLVEQTKSAEEADQKPFVYSKAQRALAQFKKGELDNFSRALLTIYHDGHLGKSDTHVELEKWVLGI